MNEDTMQQELKPCPACGWKSIHQSSGDLETVYCYCLKCCVQGPWCKTEQAAIDAWNALPRELEWEPGKNDVVSKGWYFTRPYGNIGIFTKSDILVEFFCGERKAYDSIEISGPIPEPKGGAV